MQLINRSVQLAIVIIIITIIILKLPPIRSELQLVRGIHQK
jgi:hypothetical protein